MIPAVMPGNGFTGCIFKVQVLKMKNGLQGDSRQKGEVISFNALLPYRNTLDFELHRKLANLTIKISRKKMGEKKKKEKSP